MKVKIGYIIAIIAGLSGLVILFFRLDIALFAIILAILIAFIQWILQRKSDEDRHREYVDIVTKIYDASEAQRKIESLKSLVRKKNISIKRIIEKFDKPLYSIFIYKFNEVPRGSEEDHPKPLTDLIKKLGFEIIANAFYMLLPKDMPNVDKNFDIQIWAEKNIIKKLPEKTTYTLNFVALVDLRRIFCYKTVEQGNMVFDVLTKDPSFVEKFLLSLPKEEISPKEIVQDYSIGDIITLNIDKEIIQKLNDNSKTFLGDLNCSDVLDLGLVPESLIRKELQKYIDNLSILKEVSQNLAHNSKILNEIS